jgi:hypothetical protein
MTSNGPRTVRDAPASRSSSADDRGRGCPPEHLQRVNRRPHPRRPRPARFLTWLRGDRRVADQIHRDALDGIRRHGGAGRYSPDCIRNSRRTALARNTSLQHQRAVLLQVSQASWLSLRGGQRFSSSLAPSLPPVPFLSIVLWANGSMRSRFRPARLQMIKKRLRCRTATSVPRFEVWKCVGCAPSSGRARLFGVRKSDTQPHRGTVPADDHPVPIMFNFVNLVRCRAAALEL